MQYPKHTAMPRLSMSGNIKRILNYGRWYKLNVEIDTRPIDLLQVFKQFLRLNNNIVIFTKKTSDKL